MCIYVCSGGVSPTLLGVSERSISLMGQGETIDTLATALNSLSIIKRSLKVTCKGSMDLGADYCSQVGPLALLWSLAQGA